MNRYTQILLALLLTAALASPALAQGNRSPLGGMRWDVSLDLPMWPALADLQPAVGGSFDSTGFAIGASGHWSVSQNANSELLLGVDGMIGATGSSINGFYEEVLARQLYLGASIKWALGSARNLSLDAGLGYHQVDMAEVDSEWWGSREFEHWSNSKASGFVGATWDIGAGRPDSRSGFFLGLRVHFTDFGRVYDESNVSFFPTLGANAGDLDGPLYVLRIGYSGR